MFPVLNSALFSFVRGRGWRTCLRPFCRHSCPVFCLPNLGIKYAWSSHKKWLTVLHEIPFALLKAQLSRWDVIYSDHPSDSNSEIWRLSKNWGGGGKGAWETILSGRITVMQKGCLSICNGVGPFFSPSEISYLSQQKQKIHRSRDPTFPNVSSGKNLPTVHEHLAAVLHGINHLVLTRNVPRVSIKWMNNYGLPPPKLSVLVWRLTLEQSTWASFSSCAQSWNWVVHPYKMHHVTWSLWQLGCSFQ